MRLGAGLTTGQNMLAEATEMHKARDHDRPTTRAGRERLRTLDQLDRRTAAAQRARRLVAELESDLGGGLSAARRQLAQRAGLLSAMLEDIETRWVSGIVVNLTEYGSLVDRQRRCLEALGLEHRLRDVTPDLTESAIATLRRVTT